MSALVLWWNVSCLLPSDGWDMFQLLATLKQLSKWTDEVTAGDKCDVQHQLLIYQTYDDMLALHAEEFSDQTLIRLI